MNLFISTCPICQKSKGGVNPVNHARCSKQLQQINADKKRRPALAKFSAARGANLANLILRTAA